MDADISICRYRVAAIAVVVLLLSGCRNEVRFTPDELAIADQQVVPEHRTQIDEVLVQLFGTPDEPIVPAAFEDVLDIDLLRHAAGPVASHTPGETIGLYRRHCATCHGPTGDGAGPAALYQSPYPRDFRRGVFKFKSTYLGAAPTDEDLTTTLTHGVPGTAMPSFALLPDNEIASLVAYIKYLAIRGHVEDELIRFVGEELDFDPVTGEVEEGSELTLDDTDLRGWRGAISFQMIAQPWRDAESMVVPASRTVLPQDQATFDTWAAEGGELFHDTQRANCVKCHGNSGQGVGELEDYDLWNKRQQDFVDATDRAEAAIVILRLQIDQTPPERREPLLEQIATREKQVSMRREIGNVILPPRVSIARRLTPGALRSVREPEDLFRRIHQGIAGTPMPSVGPSEPTGQGALTEEEVWKLAAYVMKLTDRVSTDLSDESQD